MTIDTEIRHVTKAGANLFLELGFSAAEAMKLHAASRKRINGLVEGPAQGFDRLRLNGTLF